LAAISKPDKARPVPVRYRWRPWSLAVVLAVSTCPSALLAADPATESDETPSLELLEFLGAWETDDGQWQDPLQLLAEVESESQAKKPEGGSDE